MTNTTRTEVYSVQCGIVTDRIAIVRTDQTTHYPISGDVVYLPFYAVTVNGEPVTGATCFDNICEARAYLEGYLAAEKVTREKWLASVEKFLASDRRVSRVCWRSPAS